MRRWAVLAASAVAAVATALPGITDRDSFPLSSYPMFSENRGRVADIDTAVGRDDADEVVRLSPQVIAGGAEVILAAETVSKSIRRGDTDDLCHEIAARANPDDVRRIEVVTERHDVIAWFAGNEESLDRRVHATCEVPE
jgi:hypothetical protein